jgi:hypothetical protein
MDLLVCLSKMQHTQSCNVQDVLLHDMLVVSISICINASSVYCNLHSLLVIGMKILALISNISNVLFSSRIRGHMTSPIFFLLVKGNADDQPGD